MKSTKATETLFTDNPAWFDQFDSSQLLSNLFNLSAQASMYIVDENQQIIYWSAGVKELTGYSSAEMLHKPCPQVYTITETSENVAFIKIARADGSYSSVKKITQPLYNRQGDFVGGIGLLTSVVEPSASIGKRNIAIDSKPNFQGILSRSPAMQDVFHIIQNAAETAATVLVRGESGAGKELVARAIHDLSARSAAPFLAINCAALSSNLLESELFGHVRGAFTGAIKDHNGLFQRAQGGTLFLDEVAELPLELQSKLLRVIQERNYIPVGGDHSIDVDVRIVAATHRSLREEVKAGRFREDLMYRLRVVPIFIPPLRERREDISLLIWHFIQQHNAENFRKIDKIEPQAMRELLDYQWPGNVRELHNVVEYAFAVGRGTTLRLSELPPEFREPQQTGSVSKSFKRVLLSADQEKSAIDQALLQNQGNINAAALALGMSRATFWRKRKQHNV